MIVPTARFHATSLKCSNARCADGPTSTCFANASYTPASPEPQRVHAKLVDRATHAHRAGHRRAAGARRARCRRARWGQYFTLAMTPNMSPRTSPTCAATGGDPVAGCGRNVGGQCGCRIVERDVETGDTAGPQALEQRGWGARRRLPFGSRATTANEAFYSRSDLSDRLRAWPASLMAPEELLRSRKRAACNGFTANTV